MNVAHLGLGLRLLEELKGGVAHRVGFFLCALRVIKNSPVAQGNDPLVAVLRIGLLGGFDLRYAPNRVRHLSSLGHQFFDLRL